MASRRPVADGRGDGGRQGPDGTAGAAMAARRSGLGAHVCFVLCGALTVYAAVSRGPLVVPVVPAQPAVPFFGASSLVTDFLDGDLAAALERVEGRQAALLFFYAPWDRACQAARRHLETAARVLSGQVDVVAINCWHVSGSCRKDVKKIASFPFLVVYLRHGRGLQYTGPMEAGHVVRFVERVLRPLVRLETLADLVRLRVTSTAVAVGYMPFSGGRPPAAYFSLLRAALLSLEAEPASELSWAVVTSGRTASRLGISHPAGVTVLSWNHSAILRAPTRGALSTEMIRTFVRLRRREMAGWLELPAHKSAALHAATATEAALLVFSRRRPLAPAADLAATAPVRRVWLEYSNCNRSDAVRVLGSLIPRMLSELGEAERRLMTSCRLREAADSSLTGHCPGPGPPRPHGAAACPAGQPDSAACPADMVGGADLAHHPDTRLREMVRQLERSRCRGLLLQADAGPERPSPPPPLPEQPPANITGLRCRTNRTLAVYLLDSGRHAALARRLGAPTDRPGAVIVDATAETQYLLEESLSEAALGRLVVDFTEGRLRRHMASRAGAEPAVRSSRGHRSSRGDGLAESGGDSGRRQGSEQGDDVASRDISSQSDISSPSDGPSRSDGGSADRPLAAVEMTTATFRQVALNRSEDVIVFFYSRGCGHCSASNHVFLAALRLFINSGLRFARIDGGDNDLRWEFSLESLPTIMYLPAYRKSESRLFPPDLPVTLGYLLRFILANARGGVRRAFFHGLCDAACRATTATSAARQAALVRRLQLLRPRPPLVRQAAELRRLRRAVRGAARAAADLGS